ncbi:hypothetical protein AB4084_21420, partial [Lysobacter sp. 2RAB21]
MRMSSSPPKDYPARMDTFAYGLQRIDRTIANGGATTVSGGLLDESGRWGSKIGVTVFVNAGRAVRWIAVGYR